MADLLQIQKGTGARPRVTYYANGVASDLDAGVPAVTITRLDGTTIASGTVTKVAATTGIYEFTLGAQAECTYLTVTWAGPIGGVTETLTTYVEVLGSHLFNIADLRALRVAGSTPFSLTATPLFTDAQIMDARAATLDEFEQILGFSPVPRFARSVVDGDGLWSVVLPHLKTHRLLSVAVNGAVQQVSSYTLRRSGILEATSGYVASGTFTAGRQNVAVEYVHGEPRVMGDGGNVAMLRAAMRLDPGLSSTASSVTTPDGVSYSFDPAGQVTRGGTVRHFGVPVIDSWLNRWSQVGLAVA